ncbi:hypothetical protein MBLNU230_g5316t1 [Neophaeotheca triangularis]
MMKEEAIQARRRMTDNQDALIPQLRDTAQAGVPYSYSQISETVLHREILRVYREARPETKMYYNLGRDTEGVNEENWVIRWLIWHVFRYRDNRNRHRRTGSPSATPDGDSQSISSAVSGLPARESQTSGRGSGNGSSGGSQTPGTNTPTRYWDPPNALVESQCQ